MTAILFDGFDHRDTATRWTANGAAAFDAQITPRTGTMCARVTTLGLLYLSLTSTEEDDVMYCGFGFFGQAVGGIDLAMLGFGEAFSITNQHVALIQHPNVRGWSIRRGTILTGAAGGPATGTELVATEPNLWVPNSWHYMEFAAKIHDSTGWVELRQDGITRLRFDGDTADGGTDQKIDQVTFNLTSGGPNYGLDDVYILNEQGSVNNSWLGDTRVYPLYPNGNGGSSTPLSGSDGNSTDNYLLVDEVGAPDTSDYVFSSTDGDQDTYTFEDLPVSVGTVRGVEVRMHAAKDDTGTKQIRSVTRRSSTDSFGADKTLAAVPLWQTHTELQEQDPHAGPGAWTITNVNGTEWGVEVRP